MFGFGKKRERLVEEHRIPLVVPVEFSTRLAVSPIAHNPNIIFTDWRENLALSDDYLPDLERHGLIPKKLRYDGILDDFWKANHQIFEKEIIKSDLRYYHIPHNNKDIAALQKQRRETEYENQEKATKPATINFLFQLHNQLKRTIDWNNQASEINKFISKSPRLPSDIVELIASYFSFGNIIIKELEILFNKTAIATPHLMKGIFFRSVTREKLQEQDPLILTDDRIIPSNEL